MSVLINCVLDGKGNQARNHCEPVLVLPGLSLDHRQAIERRDGHFFDR